MGSEKRVKKSIITLRVTPDEKEKIKANAQRCGLSHSAFLRNLGLGYTPKGVVDEKAILDLLKVNSDLKPLAEQLEICLKSKENNFQPPFKKNEIHTTLAEIKETQSALREIVLERL